MDTSQSPPVTPIKQTMSPLDTSFSPGSAYRDGFSAMRRRTSSFSSNHDRSPVSVRSSRHRFSNGSMYSDHGFLPDGGGGGGGMGNLADELEDMEEFDGQEEDVQMGEDGEEAIVGADGARDSGVDGLDGGKISSPGLKGGKLAESAEGREQDDKLSPDLEDLISSIARMASSAGTSSDDPLIPRVVGLLQDLGNQSILENGVQRLNTSTNSMTSHLTSQTKVLQSLATTLYSPLALFTSPLDPSILEETAPLIEALLHDLPLPDPAPHQGLQKLVRETANLVQTLSQLTDTLQMGKHTTNEAARHLRDSQKMVAALRRERERADAAREWLARSDWNERVRARWCAGECGDILGGFERRCDELRSDIVQAGGGGAAVVV